MKQLWLGVFALAASVAFGQMAPVDGTVVSVVLDHVQLKTADGVKIVVLPATVGVVKSTDIKWSDIKTGDWVGIDSKPGADGGQESVAINVFSPKIIERMKNAPKMQFPMASGDLMTNAPVDQVKTGTDGGALTLKADGAMVPFHVAANTPVHRLIDGTVSDIKVGAALTVRGQTNTDGSIQAAFVSVK
jgi:hypothetical protein